MTKEEEHHIKQLFFLWLLDNWIADKDVKDIHERGWRNVPPALSEQIGWQGFKAISYDNHIWYEDKIRYGQIQYRLIWSPTVDLIIEQRMVLLYFKDLMEKTQMLEESVKKLENEVTYNIGANKREIKLYEERGYSTDEHKGQISALNFVQEELRKIIAKL